MESMKAITNRIYSQLDCLQKQMDDLESQNKILIEERDKAIADLAAASVNFTNQVLSLSKLVEVADNGSLVISKENRLKFEELFSFVCEDNAEVLYEIAENK